MVVFDNSSTNIPKIPIYTNQWNIRSNQLVYNSKLDGVTSTIEYASTIASPSDHFNIYSDNQARIYCLKSISDYPGQTCQIRSIIVTQSIIDKEALIIINQVPGYTDIIGNEIADSLAKEATKLDPIENKTSFVVLGLKIKAKAS